MEANSESHARRAGVTFTGTTSEYFRIWIVNVALTIVTIGLYSPWAKVRKLRYFYGNTSIEDGHFDYHAKPKAILIGRIIAVAILGAYYFASQFLPWLGIAIIGVIFLLIPWLVVRTRVFQLRNTSYHGLRFNFRRNYADAFKTYYLGALITVLTLGFGAPTAIHMRNRFVAQNAAFGKSLFSWNGQSGPFYAIFWKSVGMFILVAILAVLVLGPVFSALGPSPVPGDESGDLDAAAELISIIVTLPLFLLYAAVGIYVQVRQRNYVWNSLNLRENNFESTLSVRMMVWLYFSNMVAIILSVGLLIPWAQIRMARYRAECMHLNLRDGWGDYKASKDSEGSALGEEIGEAFDMDIDVAF